jgi:hypothetical protein
LKGDLWWALMRLGRTDSRIVQSICIRALCDLSYPPAESSTKHNVVSAAIIQAHYQRIQALRKHNILTFMKDLTTLAHPDELLKCMQILHNLLNHFTTSHLSNPSKIATSASAVKRYDFTEQEVIAAIRVTADVILRAPNLKTIRIALLILLKCAQQVQYDKVFTEFLNIDIIKILKFQRNHWNKHPECRVSIARLLDDLVKNKAFTKATSLSDINVLWVALVEDRDDKANSSLEIIENIASMLLQFVLAESVPANDLIALSIWPILLTEGLSTESSVVSTKTTSVQFNSPLPGRRKSSTIVSSTSSTRMTAAAPAAGKGSALAAAGGSSRQSIYVKELSLGAAPTAGDSTDALKGAIPSVFRLQGITLALLAHSIDALLLGKNNSLAQITSALLQGLLKVDLVDHIWTNNNVLTVLHAASQSAHCIPALLVPETFMLLLRYLNSAAGTIRQGRAQEFSACFLRNVVLHSTYVPRLIAISHGALNEFVKEVCEELQSIDAAFDLAIFFFNTANYLVQNESNLNPKFVLNMINKLSSNDKLQTIAKTKDELAAKIQNINKYTLSMILNKYNFNHGVDPLFIQNMLSYMQSPAIALIPDLMRSIDFKTITEWKSILVVEFLQMKQSMRIDLLVFYPEQAIWQPVTHTECKHVSNAILKFTQPTSVQYEKLEAVEALLASVFTKITRHFDPVQDGAKDDNQAITEGEGDDSEGDGEAEADAEEEEEDIEDASWPRQLTVDMAEQPTVRSVSLTMSADAQEVQPSLSVELPMGSTLDDSTGSGKLQEAMSNVKIVEDEEGQEGDVNAVLAIRHVTSQDSAQELRPDMKTTETVQTARAAEEEYSVNSFEEASLPMG